MAGRDRWTKRGRSAGRRSPTARRLTDFASWCEAQGGDPRAVDDPLALPARAAEDRLEMLRRAASSRLWRRGRSATRPCCSARAGLAWTAPIDHAVGVILHKKVGDAVRVGEPLCTLLVNDESRLRGGVCTDPGSLHHRRGARCAAAARGRADRGLAGAARRGPPSQV